MLRRLMTLTCLALLTAALISACGSSGGSSTSTASNGVASKAPNEILSDTESAVTGLKSVHVIGAISQSSGNIKLNLQLGSGSNGRGAMSIKGLSFKLVNLGGTFYMNPSTAFWTHYSNPAAAKLLTGHWIKVPATGQFGAFKKFLNAQALFKSVLGNKHKLTKTAPRTFRGQKVVGLHDSVNGGTLYVATTGKPYPIAITKSGASGGAIYFTDFNQPVSITAPKGAVSLAQLESKAGSS